jgi:hypothetical protein
MLLSLLLWMSKLSVISDRLKLWSYDSRNLQELSDKILQVIHDFFQRVISLLSENTFLD